MMMVPMLTEEEHTANHDVMKVDTMPATCFRCKTKGKAVVATVMEAMTKHPEQELRYCCMTCSDDSISLTATRQSMDMYLDFYNNAAAEERPHLVDSIIGTAISKEFSIADEVPEDHEMMKIAVEKLLSDIAGNVAEHTDLLSESSLSSAVMESVVSIANALCEDGNYKSAFRVITALQRALVKEMRRRGLVKGD